MSKALIIVDPQNDFCEGGPLAVPEASQIFEPINSLRKQINFNHVFVTLDWHSENHTSFAQNHDLEPFSVIEANGKEEVLWPVHCLQNSQGAQISKLLEANGSEIIVKKGIQDDEEQYSGFGTQKYPTDLQSLLKNLNVEEVYIVGLALDYCVGNTALDAKSAGFKATVINQCTRGVSTLTSEKMVQTFKEKGIRYVNRRELEI